MSQEADSPSVVDRLVRACQRHPVGFAAVLVTSVLGICAWHFATVMEKWSRSNTADHARLYVEARRDFVGTLLLMVGMATVFTALLAVLLRHIRRDAEELEHCVSERTAQLGERTAALEKEIAERRLAERERESLQHKLVLASREAGKAEIASSVLHNVGNVLNSVNTSAQELERRIDRLQVDSIGRVAALLNDHEADLGRFVTEDERGRHLPRFMEAAGRHLEEDRDALRLEVKELTSRVDHIKHVIHMQQDHARSCMMIEGVEPRHLIDQALQMTIESLRRHGVTLRHRIEPMDEVWTDRNLVLQILVNLMSNAKDAVQRHTAKDPTIRIIAGIRKGFLCIAVDDNGVGISESDLKKLFRYGFTTKKEGHGFGLHSAALAAKQLNGRLLVRSKGEGKGATFTLEIPVDGRSATVEPEAKKAA